MPKLNFWKYHAEPADGASAPAAAPAAPAAADDGLDPSTPAVNWEGLADDLSADDLDGGEDEPAAPSAPATPTTPTPAAPAAPAATPAPATPATPAEPAAPATPPTPQPTAEELETQRQAQRAQILSAAEAVYEREMTEEVKSALLTEPEKVLPKLLAQAALDGANLATQHMLAHLPRVVQETAQTSSAQTQALQSFHRANPDLAGKEHSPFVAAAIKTVKEAGLKFKSNEDAMAKIASVARSLAGLPQPGAAPVDPPAAAPVAPHVPVARTRSAAASGKAPLKPGEVDWGAIAEPDED